MTTELAEITFSGQGHVPVARIRGEIDASNAADVQQLLTDGVTANALGLVLDLTEARYLDSSGVALIFAAATALLARNQELRLAVAPDSFVADVLRTTRVQDAAPIHSAVDEAINALSPR